MVINIKVTNRVAEYIPDGALPVCGNEGDTVRFSFDDEWQGRDPKTVRFIWGGNKFHEEKFTGDHCDVPRFINTDRILIGVFTGGDDGREQLSSTKASVPYLPSIRCGGARPDALSAESYTHEAKMAAEEARSYAAQSADAASAAELCSDQTKKHVSLAMGYSQRAEAVAYDLEERGFEVRLKEHDFRLSVLENHLGLDDSFVSLKDRSETVEIPANARQYAKISKLECLYMMNTYGDGWYLQGVTGFRVLDEEGTVLRSYTVPVASLPDYGAGQTQSYDPDVSTYHDPANNNYIAFENGKAYYYHNVYSLELSDYYAAPELRDPDDQQVDGLAFNSLIRLATPEVIDISDIFAFDGFLDLSGGSTVVFDQLEPTDGYANTEGIIMEWSPARVYMLIETEN